MKKPILIGITGGTGSGKSTIADALYSNFSNERITMIQQDMCSISYVRFLIFI